MNIESQRRFDNDPLNRLIELATIIGESRGTQILAALQIPIFADFLRRATAEGLPWYAAALYPVAAPMGFMNPIVERVTNLDEFFLVAEPMELVGVGLTAVVTTGAAAINRFTAISRGEIPIHESHALLFLNAGSKIPAAQAFGERMTNDLATEGKKPGNLFYTALYAEDTPRPTRPKSGFNRHWFAHPVDLQMNVTDTSILEQTGAFEAPVIILMGENDRVIEDTAITIRQNRKTPVRIIPLPSKTTSIEPYTTIDIDTEKMVELTEKPVNPFRFLAEKVTALSSNDLKLQGQAADYLTAGIVLQKRATRKKRVLDKIEKFSHEGKVYLYGEAGDESDERKSLEKAFADNIVDTPEEADIIISYGKGDVADDLSVSDAAEEIKSKISQGEISTDKLHLFLTYSQGNEDSAGEHAEAGTSIQRLMVQELIERTKEEVLPPPSISQITTELVRGIVHKIGGKRIRRQIVTN